MCVQLPRERSTCFFFGAAAAAAAAAAAFRHSVLRAML
jgi:hypothetical protein